MSGTWTKRDGEWMLLVPKEEAELIGAKEGSTFELTAQTVLSPSEIPSLEELLKGYPEGARGEEYDWGPPVGKEVW